MLVKLKKEKVCVLRCDDLSLCRSSWFVLDCVVLLCVVLCRVVLWLRLRVLLCVSMCCLVVCGVVLSRVGMCCDVV